MEVNFEDERNTKLRSDIGKPTERKAGVGDRLSDFYQKYKLRYFCQEEKKRELFSDNASVHEKQKEAVKAAGTVLVSFIMTFARLYDGACPFGPALLCSAERGIPSILLGYILSSAVKGDFFPLDLAMAAVAVFIRMAVGISLRGGRDAFASDERGGIVKELFTMTEPLPMRMATGAFCGFVSGLIRLVAGGFFKGDLAAAFVMIASVPILVYIFYGMAEKTLKFSFRYDIALLAAGVGITIGLDRFSGGGIELPIVFVSLITLCSGAKGGPLSGITVGVILGLVTGIERSPMFGLMGFIAGAIRGSGQVLPMLASCGVGAVISFCIEGFPSLGITIPNLMWGGAVYAPLARLGLLSCIVPLGSQASLPRELAANAALADLSEKSDSERLLAMSDALSSLSKVFYEMSEKLGRPDMSEMRDICEGTLRGYCKSCPSSFLCWGDKYSQTYDAVNMLARATLCEGRGDTEFALKDFFERCPHVMKTANEVNLIYARRLEAAARENRTAVFALDYEAMARLIRSAAEERRAENEYDVRMTEKARRAALDMGLRVNSVAVIGQRRKHVILSGAPSSVNKSARELAKGFSDALGIRLSQPSFEIKDDYVTATLRSAPVISASCSRSQIKKENESISGDTCSYFTCDGMLYAIICDGMGSGREAAITSRITVMFMNKLLSAGNKKGIVLEMVNDFIRNKNLECFTTLDLFSLDLLSGKASFVKSGAASSYILRYGKLFKISSNSLPIGITREITAEEIKLTLYAGDTVIMISDGISQSFEDGAWLAELLSCDIKESHTSEEISALILEKAREQGKRDDDMTVCTVKISGIEEDFG